MTTGTSFLDGKIGSTEAAWLGGALSLSERKVEQIMTAMDDVVGVFEEDRRDAFDIHECEALRAYIDSMVEQQLS